jgi:hypothetical protein
MQYKKLSMDNFDNTIYINKEIKESYNNMIKYQNYKLLFMIKKNIK